MMCENLEEKSFRILVTDPLDDKGMEILQEVAEVDVKLKLTEDELAEIVGNYDAWMVRSGTKVTKRLIEAGKNLKIIGRAGVGVDNVHVSTATERGIYVVNSPQGNTVAAAEHTIGLMICLARRIPQAMISILEGKWERSKFMGYQLQGKIVGIIGLGQVGQHVARVLKEMGMDVQAYDPYINDEKAKELNVKIHSLEKLLKTSDFICLHIPLVDATKHIINKERIALMKPTAYVINASRGGVINEEDLAEALEKNQIAGAALDVFEDERPFPSNHPFIQLIKKDANLVLTPHLGASTHEAQMNVAVDVAQQIQDVLLGQMPQSAINLPGLRSSELTQLLPILKCGKLLGRILGQLVQEPVLELKVSLEGDVSKERTEPILLAVTQGILSVNTANRVNFVNVKKIATDFKIQLLASKDTTCERSGLGVTVVTKSRRISINGNVMKNGFVILNCFKGFPIYLVLPFSCHRKMSRSSSAMSMSQVEDQKRSQHNCDIPLPVVHMFYTYHDDVPGILAKVSSELSSENINIANCHLGRKIESVDREERKMGLCFFQTDEPVPESIIEKLRRMECIKECRTFTSLSTFTDDF